MRANYWTIGAFADWLRGTASLKMGTSKEWRDWKRAAKAKHPIRFWLADEGLQYLQNFVMWPLDQIDSARYYINNRWISRSHSLTAHPTDIKPGHWCDVGHRFLPCLFNELVNFVEVETAVHHVLWDENARSKYKFPNKWPARWFNRRTWRCPEAGIEHLEWAAGLTHSAVGAKPGDKNYNMPTGQAIGAREILDLYYWWTQERPNRADPNDISGWSDICERRRGGDEDLIFGEDNTPTEKKETQKALATMRKIEQQYEKEDEQMMIRLIRIRESLWT